MTRFDLHKVERISLESYGRSRARNWVFEIQSVYGIKAVGYLLASRFSLTWRNFFFLHTMYFLPSFVDFLVIFNLDLYLNLQQMYRSDVAEISSTANFLSIFVD